MSFALRDRPRPGDEAALPAIAAACGNFSDDEIAFVPEILEKLIEEGEARSGDTALLIAFGAGLAYAAQVVTVP